MLRIFLSFLLLSSVALLMSGCEKDSLATEAVLSEELSSKFTWSDPIPDDVTFADVSVEVVQGVLSFPTVDDYRRAQFSIAKATDEEYAVWANGLGFTSQYTRYRELLDQLEGSELPLFSKNLSKEDSQFITIDEEGRPDLRFPSRLYACLLNAEGKVLINGDLNVYTDTYHLLVDEADPTQLAKGLSTLVTDYHAGVIVEPVRIVTEDGSSENQKVNQTNFDCPLFGGDDNILIVRRTDQQTLSGSKQELRSSLLFGSQTLTLDNTTGEYEVLYAMTIFFENWRKQGLTWKHTQPTSRATYHRDNPGTSSGGSTRDPLRVDRLQEVYVAGSGFVTVASTFNAPVSEDADFAGTGQNIPAGNGADVIFDDTTLTGFFTPGTADGRASLYSIINGTAAIRWTNRGKNLDHDPMSTEFNCQ